MFPIFLIGGGWESAGWNHTYGPFVRRASPNGRCKIALILVSDEGDDRAELEARYRQPFETCGVLEEDLVFGWGSATVPPPLDALVSSHPTGVFVGGGLTPLYQTWLCHDLAWLNYLHQNHIPYAGFSAGAAIAAQRAIVGGWQVQRDDLLIDILDADFGENLTMLEVRDGLGLVPFAIDVHASQWGTLTRLMQAVDLNLVGEGWTVDENTMLWLEDGRLEIRGLGQAYRVQRQAADTLAIQMYRDGAKLQLS